MGSVPVDHFGLRIGFRWLRIIEALNALAGPNEPDVKAIFRVEVQRKEECMNRAQSAAPYAS